MCVCVCVCVCMHVPHGMVGYIDELLYGLPMNCAMHAPNLLYRCLINRIDHNTVLVSRTSKGESSTRNVINAQNRMKMSKNYITIYQPLSNVPWSSQEKGASTWLTAFPIDEHGLAMHKVAFRDSLSLRYGWPMLVEWDMLQQHSTKDSHQ